MNSRIAHVYRKNEQDKPHFQLPAIAGYKSLLLIDGTEIKIEHGHLVVPAERIREVIKNLEECLTVIEAQT